MNHGDLLKIDMESITKYQKSLYYSDNDKDKINSRFSANIEKYSWSCHDKIKLVKDLERIKNENREDIFVTYSIPTGKKYDILFKSELQLDLDSIKVKDEYKDKISICYPKNPGHNIIYYGQLIIDDDPIQSFDSIWLDNYSQWFMKKEKRELYNRMIGNVKELTEWQTELPEYKLIVPQPYFYSKNTRVGLLLSTSKIHHRYKLRSYLSDFLRMRVKNEEGYQEIPCDLDYLELPEIKIKELRIPDLKARASVLTEEEFKWLTEETHTLYPEDIICLNSFTPIKSGNIIKIPLYCKAGAKGIFWTAQSIQDVKLNNLSNYSSNKKNSNKKNPCQASGVTYGESIRVPLSSHEDFDMSEAWDFFPSAPVDVGYNAYSICYDYKSLHLDTGIVLTPLNAGLLVKIETDEKEKKYIIHVRILTYKKLEITWDGQKFNYLVFSDFTNKI